MKNYTLFDFEENQNFQEPQPTYKQMSIPQILLDICDFIKSQSLELSANKSDGRVNSTDNEGEIIACIQQKFKIDIPKERAWCDFSITHEGVFYPVNIKVSTCEKADNLSSKLGLYYALTGLFPNFQNEIKWEDFFSKLAENIAKNSDTDYYFLVVNKKNNKDIFINSLKGLSSLTPNGSNLPFQCNWGKNKTQKPRTFDEAKEFLLKTLSDSLKLSANKYISFQKHFPNYV